MENKATEKWRKIGEILKARPPRACCCWHLAGVASQLQTAFSTVVHGLTLRPSSPPGSNSPLYIVDTRSPLNGQDQTIIIPPL